MADYIERQAALDALRDVTNDQNCPAFIAATVEQILTEAPAANVREDVQGKWIKSHWRGSTSCANCSVCDFEAQHSEFRGVQKYYKICPNCGARMVGGREQ